jgi:hypothetical protein
MNQLNNSKNLVRKINNDVCYVSLECFIDISDSEKLLNLNIILQETEKYKTIFAALVWENRPVQDWLPYALLLRRQRKCEFLFDLVYQERIAEIPEARFVCFFALRVWYETEVLKLNQINTSWNPNTNMFLFLTGKPNRINRAFLLKKLLEASLEKNCLWSLFVNQDTYKHTQQILSLSNIEFDNFLKKTLASPDNIKVLSSYKSTHYGGFPYDHTMYQKTSFRIISETQFTQNEPWITEKTWLTILNHHPFIMAGNTTILNRLESMGFCTFTEYLKISDYSNIQNSYDRIDAIVINAKDWLTTIKNDKTAIEQDIKHNYNQFCQLMHKELTNLAIVCNSVDITIESLLQVGFLSDIIDMSWILFYNNIKDDSWPICLNEKSFYHLPVDIKQELVEFFGFSPKQ